MLEVMGLWTSFGVQGTCALNLSVQQAWVQVGLDAADVFQLKVSVNSSSVLPRLLTQPEEAHSPPDLGLSRDRPADYSVNVYFVKD